MYYVAGELVNTSSNRYGSVAVIAHFYDASDQLVPTVDNSGWAIYGITNPGEVNPFAVYVPTDASAGVARSTRYELTVNPYPVYPSYPEYVRLTIVSTQMTPDATNRLEIRGTVRNDTPTLVTYAEVIATYYDQNGNVVDVRGTFPEPDELLPGQSGQFSFTTSQWTAGTGPYLLVADGEVEH